MSTNINATKCAAYLRSVGITVSTAVATEWVATECAHRTRKRAHNRELKKSCGHFRTSIGRVISEEYGDEAVTVCDDCREYIARKPWPKGPPPRRRKPLPARRSA